MARHYGGSENTNHGKIRKYLLAPARQFFPNTVIEMIQAKFTQPLNPSSRPREQQIERQ